MIRIVALAGGNAALLGLLVLTKGGDIKLGAMAALAVVVGSLLGLAVVRVAEEYTTYPEFGE